MPFLGSPLIHRAMSAEEGPRTVLCNQNRFVGILLVYSVERRSQIAVFTVEIAEVLVETDYVCQIERGIPTAGGRPRHRSALKVDTVDGLFHIGDPVAVYASVRPYVGFV